MTFQDLGIIDPILRALKEEGYAHPTPIQEQAIPMLLRGKDLLGCAQTGTGKTCAFAVPIIQQIYEDPATKQGKRKIQALVVAPTRELALQIDESFKAYGRFTGLRSTVIFGGVKQGSQVQALQRGVDVLVATPGRLLDLIGQRYISLKDVKYSVLDEADHMLDMGFIHDIKKIIRQLPDQRQSLFFSATMSKEIRELAKRILDGHPEKVTIRPEQTTSERVDQGVYFVSKQDKRKLLVHLLQDDAVESALVFSRTKHGADKIVRVLSKSGVHAAAIHGNKSQNARQRALGQFKDGKINVLVATDIAARGIDVDELSHVINYDLPNVPETYVHRIGRTGRAKASGVALSFCDQEERAYLKDIQKLIDQRVPVIEEHPFPDTGEASTQPTQQQQSRSGNNNRNHRRKRQGGGGNRRNSRQRWD
jgi:ATP-dependent RNA helicase RhlE